MKITRNSNVSPVQSNPLMMAEEKSSPQHYQQKMHLTQNNEEFKRFINSQNQGMPDQQTEQVDKKGETPQKIQFQNSDVLSGVSSSVSNLQYTNYSSTKNQTKDYPGNVRVLNFNNSNGIINMNYRESFNTNHYDQHYATLQNSSSMGAFGKEKQIKQQGKIDSIRREYNHFDDPESKVHVPIGNHFVFCFTPRKEKYQMEKQIDLNKIKQAKNFASLQRADKGYPMKNNPFLDIIPAASTQSNDFKPPKHLHNGPIFLQPLQHRVVCNNPGKIKKKAELFNQQNILTDLETGIMKVLRDRQNDEHEKFPKNIEQLNDSYFSKTTRDPNYDFNFINTQTGQFGTTIDTIRESNIMTVEEQDLPQLARNFSRNLQNMEKLGGQEENQHQEELNNQRSEDRNIHELSLPSLIGHSSSTASILTNNVGSENDKNSLIKGIFMNINTNSKLNLLEQKSQTLVKIQSQNSLTVNNLSATPKAIQTPTNQLVQQTVKKEEISININNVYGIFMDSGALNQLSQEKQVPIQISAVRDYYFAMNFAHNLYVNTPNQKGSSIYQAVVGQGNNHILIRMVIKQRWWWSLSETREGDNINLLWTQSKKNDYMESLKQLCKNTNHNTTTNSNNNMNNSNILNLTGNSNNINFSNNNNNNNSMMSSSGNQMGISNSTKQTVLTSQTNLDISTTSNLVDMSDESGGQNSDMDNGRSNSLILGLKSTQATQQRKISLTQLQLKSKNSDFQNSPKQIAQNSTFLPVGSNQCSGLLQKVLSQSDHSALHQIFSNRKGKSVETSFVSVAGKFESVKELKKNSDWNEYQDPTVLKMHNHLDNHFHLSNKQALFYNLRQYYSNMRVNVFDYIPLTFHIQNGKKDPEYQKFYEYYVKSQKEATQPELPAKQKLYNIWIVKPGENTNRGTGITVCQDIKEIDTIIESMELHQNGMRKTYIIQKYMQRPLLYRQRKFDIRCYMLLNSFNGCLQGYWFQQGYVRTASQEFSMKNLSNQIIHLTNDAVQKQDQSYGKFERGNKVSFQELAQYINTTYPEAKIDFYEDLVPQMRDMAKDSIRAVFPKLDPNKRENTFELFGLDFMIDENFQVWLIEVNTNPCLELSSSLLSRIIPSVVENVFRIAVDPIFPPPVYSAPQRMVYDNVLQSNKFQLIFDEIADGPGLLNIIKDTNFNWGPIEQIEEQQEYEDEDDEVVQKEIQLVQ